ncbi:hypothetical protein [Salinispora mooreana]|nr:hypothetical protein [Salinispora mooreana]
MRAPTIVSVVRLGSGEAVMDEVGQPAGSPFPRRARRSSSLVEVAV